MVEDGDPSSCYMTGGDLLEELQTSEDDDAYSVIVAHAYGYITAVVDAHTLFHSAENFPPIFDFPRGELGQVASIIEEELKKEPDLLDGTAASLVVRIFQRHFPSEEKRKGKSK